MPMSAIGMGYVLKGRDSSYHQHETNSPMPVARDSPSKLAGHLYEGPHSERTLDCSHWAKSLLKRYIELHQQRPERAATRAYVFQAGTGS